MKEAKIKRKRAKYFAFIFVFYLFFAGNIYAQNNLEILAEQINRGDSEQKRNALFQIRNLKTAEASRLAISALRDKDEIVRASAASSVIFLSSDEAAARLLPLLRDKKPFVRKEAAYALGKTRNLSAIRPLIEIIQKDKIQEVKSAATVALGEIGDVSAVSALITILQRQPKTQEEFTRRAAARSIGQIAQIVQIGETHVMTPQNSGSENFKAVKSDKYTNLTETNPIFGQAVSVLIQILQSSDEFSDVKREAAFALGAIGEISAIPVLQANLNAEDYYLSQICRESLQKLRSVAE